MDGVDVEEKVNKEKAVEYATCIMIRDPPQI